MFYLYLLKKINRIYSRVCEVHQVRHFYILYYFSLDLDTWINDPPSESDSDDNSTDDGIATDGIFIKNKVENKFYQNERNQQPEPTPEEIEKV